MANYYGMTRTNYFHVKDVDRFREIINKTATADVIGEELTIWPPQKADDGTLLFSFGGYTSILGFEVLPDGVTEEEYNNNPYDYDVEYDYDAFAAALQEVVVPGDAIIIQEIGNEKLRYLVGDITIITSDDIRYMNIRDLSINLARKMLGNNNWDTKLEY